MPASVLGFSAASIELVLHHQHTSHLYYSSVYRVDYSESSWKILVMTLNAIASEGALYDTVAI